MSENDSNSLMRKTKQELVNIILRKDDVENTLNIKLNDAETKNKLLNNANEDLTATVSLLNNKIEAKDKALAKMDVTLTALKEKNAEIEAKCHDVEDALNISVDKRNNAENKYNALKADYEQFCDEHVSVLASMNDKVTRYKTYTIITFVVLVSVCLFAFCK